MSSWRRGRRSPAATWSTLGSMTAAQKSNESSVLPAAATPPGQCLWSSRRQDARPAAVCSSPWSRSYAGRPWWTPPYLHRKRDVRERCGMRLRELLTCSDIVDSLGCSDRCFSKFSPNLRTNSRLKTENREIPKKLENSLSYKQKLLLIIFTLIIKYTNAQLWFQSKASDSLLVLLRWSSDVSSGRCSLSQTSTQRYRACLQTPEPPRVCSNDKVGLFQWMWKGGRRAWFSRRMNEQHLGSSTNFSTSITSSLKDFLASRLADSNCSRKSASDRAMRIPYTQTHTPPKGTNIKHIYAFVQRIWSSFCIRSPSRLPLGLL